MTTATNTYRVENSWARTVGGKPIFLASRNDPSPEYLKYESQCSWCYVGANHTVAAHNVG